MEALDPGILKTPSWDQLYACRLGGICVPKEHGLELWERCDRPLQLMGRSMANAPGLMQCLDCI